MEQSFDFYKNYEGAVTLAQGLRTILALPADQSLMGNILVEASQVPVTLDMNDLLPSSGPTCVFCKGGAHMHTYT